MVLNVCITAWIRTYWNYQFNYILLLQTISTLREETDSFTSVCLALWLLPSRCFVYKCMLAKIASVCMCVCLHTYIPISLHVCIYIAFHCTSLSQVSSKSHQNLRGSVLFSRAVKSQTHSHGSYIAQPGFESRLASLLALSSLLHCLSVWHHGEFQDRIKTNWLYARMSPNIFGRDEL